MRIMKDYVKLTLILSFAGVLNSACVSASLAPPAPPAITECSIYRPGLAECESDDPRKSNYDLDLNSVEALGYKLTPPEDYAKFYIWLEEIVEWIRNNRQSRRK